MIQLLLKPLLLTLATVKKKKKKVSYTLITQIKEANLQTGK